MELINITNQYLSAVTWANSTLSDFDNRDGVDVWRIPVSLNLPFLDTFIALLSPAEIVRYNRFYQQTDKNRFVVSHGAVRIILGKYLNQPPESLQFGEGINKKPYLASPNNANLCFNISHSGDWILITVANTETGADTELINDNFNFSDVINENFGAEEVIYINNVNSVERFFMLWTRKEALIKATGIGLIDELKLLPSLDGHHSCNGNIINTVENWQVNSFKLDEQHIGSIAFNPKTSDIRFNNFIDKLMVS